MRNDFLLSSFLAVIYSIVFSLPSLGISLLIAYLLSLLPWTPVMKFFSWLLLALLIVLLNYVLVVRVISDGAVGFIYYDFVIPGLIAVLLAIVCRYSYFIKVCEEIIEKKNNLYGKDAINN
jgi:hypothetical protein